MKYEKPEVIAIGSACICIQNGVKGLGFYIDLLLEYTIGAYEADE
jgi:hypothetical protein